jgi:hypothetical protein
MKKLLLIYIVAFYGCLSESSEDKRPNVKKTNLFKQNTRIDIGEVVVEPIDSLTTLTILKSIRQLPIVQRKEKDVEHISKNKRHLKYNVSFEDSTKRIYNVLVFEDNGMSFSTHFNFRVDRKTLKILNLDGKY